MPEFNKNLNRREMIKLMGWGVASIYLGGCTTVSQVQEIPPSAVLKSIAAEPAMSTFGPFDRTMGDIAPRRFSGDVPEKGHKILWNKKEFIAKQGGLPPPTENANLVVVGGGMSGLLSTYMSRNQNPILLEQGDRFGGNSRGESWQGIDYSLATAYFGVPPEGGQIDEFFKQIGIKGKYRVRKGADPIVVDGKTYDDVWSTGTVPESTAQFKFLNQHFTDVLNEANGQMYPEIPIKDEEKRKRTTALDKMTFKKYLEKLVKGKLHPHVEQVIDHYFWSAGASTYREISAAAGLNFFAGDFGEVAVAPGGNGFIAEATLASIMKDVPLQNLRPSSLVIDVRVVGQNVHVSYVDAQDKLKTIKAKSVIMSCPKFIAAVLIDDLESDRLRAIKSINYRGYLLANVLVNQPLKDSFYDLFFFDKNNPDNNVKESALKQRATDLVYGNYAKPDNSRTILTVFRGFPYEGARAGIYDPGAYEKYRGEFEDQIHSNILPMLNIPKSNVVDVRMARWGHPLPVPMAGNIASGKVELLRKPFKKRVFFVEQDNWTLPCFETAFSEASFWTPKVVDLVMNQKMS